MFSSCWIGLTPTATDLTQLQKNKLSKLCSTNITAGVQAIEQSELWAQAKNPNSFRAIFPVRFTLPVGAAEQLDLLLACNPAKQFDKQLEAILTPQQLGAVTKNYEERRAFQTRCLVGHVVNIFDAELCLSNDQRERFRQSISERVYSIDGRAVSLTPNQAYYPQQPLYSEITHASFMSVLTGPQKVRAKAIEASGKATGWNSYCRATGVRSSLMEFHSRDVDRWQDDLNVVTAAYEKVLTQIFAVRIEYQQQRCDLTDEMLRELVDVSESVSDEVLADWKFAAQLEVNSRKERAEEIRGRSVFGFSLPAMELSKIDRHPDWEAVVEKLMPHSESPVDPRLEARRKEDALTIVGLLDKELWLQPKQRESLTELIYSVTPDGGFVPSVDNFAVEVSMLLVPLLNVAEEDLTFLTTHQLVVWKGLRGYFLTSQGQVARTQRPESREMLGMRARLVSPARRFSVPVEILR